MTEVATASEILRPEALKLPKTPRVLEIKVMPHIDSTGDDSLRVTVILDNKTTDAQRDWKKIEPIERAIYDTLLQNGINLFPYIWFRTRAEYNAQQRRRS